MRVLIACEFSGIVREAFTKAWPEFDVWSCDLLPSEKPGKHLQCDVGNVLNDNWDLLIAHPPCTHLAVSGPAGLPKRMRNTRSGSAKRLTSFLCWPMPIYPTRPSRIRLV